MVILIHLSWALYIYYMKINFRRHIMSSSDFGLEQNSTQRLHFTDVTKTTQKFRVLKQGKHISLQSIL